ncbi:hypothetical protein ACHAWF_008499 [Thalassiosira exigua]
MAAPPGTGDPSSSSSSWERFLRSPALSFPSPPPSNPPLGSGSGSGGDDPYWRRDLLARWAEIETGIAVDDDDRRGDGDGEGGGPGPIDGREPGGLVGGTGGGEEGGGEGGGGGVARTTTIDYARHLLLATSLADALRARLRLVPAPSAALDDCRDVDAKKRWRDEGQMRKVAVAVPEGPFLPPLVLAVHSLCVAASEGWLLLDDDDDNGDGNGDGGESDANRGRNDGAEVGRTGGGIVGGGTHARRRCECESVVLIPTEADEAPERLGHMLRDARPGLILVAPGRDYDCVARAAGNSTRVPNGRSGGETRGIEAVDFARLVDEALGALRERIEREGFVGLTDRTWPTESRRASERFDVATLVAAGSVRMAPSLPVEAGVPYRGGRRASPRSDREATSHVVYTSGTTGRPKGCASSLASLRRYVCAKNVAHGIDETSRVLLASAISFDPCFSDVLATCEANACLCLAPREMLHGRSGDGLGGALKSSEATHVLCTPALWATVLRGPEDFPSLRVAALGGEPVPKATASRWARRRARSSSGARDGEYDRAYPRLYATYGVTEACVYQTCGEVVLERDGDDAGRGESAENRSKGQSVGRPLIGTNVRICAPLPEDAGRVGEDVVAAAALAPAARDEGSSDPPIGEVVLSGAQVDSVSSYWNLPEQSARAFVRRPRSDDDEGATFGADGCFYRTGDLGYVDPRTGNLHILGRIGGDGMVKINGVRIELAEVEDAVADDAPGDPEGTLVVDCAASTTGPEDGSGEGGSGTKRLVAYCLLSEGALSQLGLPAERLRKGAIVPPGPLLSVLRERCDRRVRRGCTPSSFVLVDRIPLSATGKRDRGALPKLSECSLAVTSSTGDEASLWTYGGAGSLVAEEVAECLNLQPCQRQLVTPDANFFSLGGDSLAATRVVRSLYARYHGVCNSRKLGGATGTLDGPFAAIHLLRSDTLGDYVDYLDAKLDQPLLNPNRNVAMIRGSTDNETKQREDPLYESLVKAATLGYTAVASSLLSLGVDPNGCPNRGRLGKITDRNQRRATFKSNPLHLACSHGNSYLVEQLLSKGKSPSLNIII